MESEDSENHGPVGGRIQRDAARKCNEKMIKSGKVMRKADRMMERQRETGPEILQKQAKSWAFEVWGNWFSRHFVPIYNVVVDEKAKKVMKEHSVWCRDSVAVPGVRKRALPDQPHPLLFTLATLLGFNTDSKLMMAELFRIHSLEYPKVSGRAGSAPHVLAVNEMFESYLRFRSDEYQTGGRGGRVWPERLKQLDSNVVYAINALRVGPLTRLSRRYRAVIRDVSNMRHQFTSDICVQVPPDLFFELLGTELLEGELSSCLNNIVQVCIYNLSVLDVFFPPDHHDRESEAADNLHPVQGHALISRWYLQHFDHGNESWKRKIVVPCVLKYSLVSHEMWISGRIACWSKPHTNAHDAAWEHKQTAFLEGDQVAHNLVDVF